MTDAIVNTSRRRGGGRAARIALQQTTTGNEAVHGGIAGGRRIRVQRLDILDPFAEGRLAGDIVLQLGVVE